MMPTQPDLGLAHGALWRATGSQVSRLSGVSEVPESRRSTLTSKNDSILSYMEPRALLPDTKSASRYSPCNGGGGACCRSNRELARQRRRDKFRIDSGAEFRIFPLVEAMLPAGFEPSSTPRTAARGRGVSHVLQPRIPGRAAAVTRPQAETQPPAQQPLCRRS